MQVVVVYAAPAECIRVELDLPVGAVVDDALRAATASSAAIAAVLTDDTPVGVFGERVGRSHLLAAHDRVELYLPLRVDPVEVRRLSARRKRSG